MVRLPPPNLTAELSLPFTRKSLATIRTALTRGAQEYPPITADPKEKHAAVLIPLCNVNNQPGVLLELRGKLRTHSGEVRYVTPLSKIASWSAVAHDGWRFALGTRGFFSFPGGRVDAVSTGRWLFEQHTCGGGTFLQAATWLTEKVTFRETEPSLKRLSVKHERKLVYHPTRWRSWDS
jgi:hypothetical protein